MTSEIRNATLRSTSLATLRSSEAPSLRSTRRSTSRKSKILKWKCRDLVFTMGGRPLIMGVLNVTSDSFSDGGRYFDRGSAVARGLQMMEEGADIIDVGGESTRPGARAIEVADELKRVIPIIEELAGKTDAVISIDTMKAAVARRAVEAGARIINDVSALTHDPRMADVAVESGTGVILMHMLGTPRTMQDSPQYDDVVAEVSGYLNSRADELVAKGLDRNSLAVDPGIGFGKTVEHNVRLLANLDVLGACGLPVVVGLSRKSFLGKLTGRAVDERLSSSLAALVFCVLNGAHVMRVHDVKESCDAARIAAVLDQHNERKGKQAGVEE